MTLSPLVINDLHPRSRAVSVSRRDLGYHSSPVHPVYLCMRVRLIKSVRLAWLYNWRRGEGGEGRWTKKGGREIRLTARWLRDLEEGGGTSPGGNRVVLPRSVRREEARNFPRGSRVPDFRIVGWILLASSIFSLSKKSPSRGWLDSDLGYIGGESREPRGDRKVSTETSASQKISLPLFPLSCRSGEEGEKAEGERGKEASKLNYDRWLLSFERVASTPFYLSCKRSCRI